MYSGYRGMGRGLGRGMGRRAFPMQNMPNISPPGEGVFRVVATLDGNLAFNSPISYRFARAPYVGILDLRDGRVLNLQIIPNSLATGAGGVGIALAQWIISIGAAAVLGSRFGPNLMMVLQQTNIRTYTVNPGIPLSEAVKVLGVHV